MQDESAEQPSRLDIAKAEEACGCRFPSSYLEFLALGGLSELRFRCRILSPTEISESIASLPSKGFVPFADNGCGDLYVWEVSGEVEPRVFFMDHDAQDAKLVAMNFVEWLLRNRF